MTDYGPKDFEGLMFNVYNHPLGTDLLKVFPILGSLSVFKKQIAGIDQQTAIRYVVYAFDKGSPVQALDDIMERRVIALELAGVERPENGEYEEEIDMMLRSLVPEINNMTIQYCILNSENDYAIYVAYQETLRRQLADMLSSEKKETEIKTLIGNINSLNANLDKLSKNIFTNNIDPFLTRSLIQFGTAKRYELSPEHFSQEMFDHDNISRYYKTINNKMRDILLMGKAFKVFMEKEKAAIEVDGTDWKENETVVVKEYLFGKLSGNNAKAVIDKIGLGKQGKFKLELMLA